MSQVEMIATLKVINKMQADGIIGKYAKMEAVRPWIFQERMSEWMQKILPSKRAMRNAVGSTRIRSEIGDVGEDARTPYLYFFERA